MAILSSLLDLAGFYLPPFYVNTEEEVQLVAEDKGKALNFILEITSDIPNI